jgi:hypothetical protein
MTVWNQFCCIAIDDLIIIVHVEVTLDMGGYDIEAELFQPLQMMLDQCKGAKSMSKYVTCDV